MVLGIFCLWHVHTLGESLNCVFFAPQLFVLSAAWPFVVEFWHILIIRATWIGQEHFAIFLLLTSVEKEEKVSVPFLPSFKYK